MRFYVEVEPGIKLYVEDLGAGKPVLLIHGWPVDHNMFEYDRHEQRHPEFDSDSV